MVSLNTRLLPLLRPYIHLQDRGYKAPHNCSLVLVVLAWLQPACFIFSSAGSNILTRTEYDATWQAHKAAAHEAFCSTMWAVLIVTMSR